MRSCTNKAQLQYLTCQSQVKERPKSELKLFSRMTDKLVNLFNHMSMMHECAVEFLTSIGKNSQESFFQVSASPDQIDSETFHRVSAPPNLDISGISQQESAPFSSDDIESYHQVSASPDQNSPEISHQVSAHNSDQKSTGEGWEHNGPNESDETIQEVSWYDISGGPHEPDQNGKSENEVPIQEVSWYAIPGVLENEITPNPPDSDNAQTKLSQGTKPSEQTSGNSTTSPIVGNNETKILNNTYDNPVITSDGVTYRTVSPVVENSETKMLNNTYSNPVITNQDANIANNARPQLNSKTNSGQYLDFSGKCTQPSSRSNNTRRSKKSASRAQKSWFTRLSTHKRKQRNSTQISKKLSRTHKTMRTKIGKLQTIENVHQNFTTSNYISPSHMLPFLSRCLLKRPKVKVKQK